MTWRMPHPQAPFATIICRAKDIGKRTHSLNGEAASKSALRIGFVELFGECVCGRRFVHAYQFFEAAENYISCLRHQVAAKCAARIRQAIFMTGACRVQQQARSFNGISADDDCFSFLLVSRSIRSQST